MSPKLQAIIEEAYEVFSDYRVAGRLTVCNCNVCMTLEAERVLARTPLREIPSSLLAEYTNSAHGYDEDSIATELKHFLPRYFELIAAYDPPDSMGLDQCLRRLGEASYRTKWPAREAEIIDEFFDAFLAASTEKLEVEEWPSGSSPAFDILDAITLALTAGADVDRLIRAIDGAPDPGAAVHLAALRGRVLRTPEGYVLDSAYLRDAPHAAAAARFGAWLVNPALRARIEAAFFMVDDSGLQEILSRAAW